jgi:glucose-1-phosphate thymidylyltransferase
LREATEFVKAIEKRTGLKIACLEEIALRMEYIDKEQLIELSNIKSKSSYQMYIKSILKN